MLRGQAKGANPPEEFERLVAPHVKSFDYFIGEGMETAVRLLEPLEVSCSRPAAVLAAVAAETAVALGDNTYTCESSCCLHKVL